MPSFFRNDLAVNPLLVCRAVFWGRPRYGDTAFNTAVKIRFGIVPEKDDDPHDGVLAVLHVAESVELAERLYSTFAASSDVRVTRAYLVDVSERAGHVLSSAPIESKLAEGDSLIAVFDLRLPDK